MKDSRIQAPLLTLALLGVLVGKTYFARATALGDANLAQALLVDGTVILALVLIVDALFADGRLKAYAVLDIIISALLAAITVYTRFYDQVPTHAAVQMLGQATTVGSSIWSLMRPEYLWFVADIPVWIAAAWLWPVLVKRFAPDRPVAEWRMLPKAVYALIVPALVVLVISIASIRKMPEPSDSLAASRTRGMYAFVLANLVPKNEDVSLADVKDPAKLQSSIDTLLGYEPGARRADFEPGSVAGKNLIIIQVEALQTAAVGATMGGQPVTPNLNRLISRSWYFPQGVTQVGRGTTVDAEFTENTSLYPALQGAASLQYADRTLTSLPRLLHDQGYETMTFHTNSAQYWNRTQLYPALGFDKYFDSSFFGDEDKIMFGSSDEVLFKKALPELVARQREKRPFYAQLITMSSHYPFDAIPTDRLPVHPSGPFADTTTGRYLASISYADKAIGGFIAQLDSAGILDDSIVVILGDHFGLEDLDAKGADAAALQALFGRKYTFIDKMTIPIIIHMPKQKTGRVVDEPMGQIDFLPTVADPLGLNLSATPHFGRDVFEETPFIMTGIGFMAPGTYMDSKFLFVPGNSFEDGKAYDIASRSQVSLDDASRAKWERMRRLLLLSDEYVRALPRRGGYDPTAPRTLPAARE